MSFVVGACSSTPLFFGARTFQVRLNVTSSTAVRAELEVRYPKPLSPHPRGRNPFHCLNNYLRRTVDLDVDGVSLSGSTEGSFS